MFPVSLSHLSLLSLSPSPIFCRVFGDRSNDDKDREQFNTILSEKLGTHMDVTFHSICQNRILPTFDDFVNQNQNYENLVDSDKLKVHMQKVVKDYKETPGTVPMALVHLRLQRVQDRNRQELPSQ